MVDFEIRHGNNHAYPYEARVGAIVRLFASEDEARGFLIKEGVI